MLKAAAKARKRRRWPARQSGETGAASLHKGRRQSKSTPRGAGTKEPLDPRRKLERYTELARAAALAGDVVETQRNLQYAEHFIRLMNEKTR